jgi:hypothetical protein
MVLSESRIADKYSCKLFDAPHELNAEMQQQAWDSMKRWV